MVAQTSSYAVLLVALSRFFRRVPKPFAAFLFCTLAGFVAISAIAGPALLSMRWGQVPASAFLALAWAGVGVSFVAHSLNTWAVRHVAAVLPAVYVTLQPLFTIALSAIFLGEHLLVRWVARPSPHVPMPPAAAPAPGPQPPTRIHVRFHTQRAHPCLHRINSLVGRSSYPEPWPRDP